MKNLTFIRQKPSLILLMYFNRVMLYAWSKNSLNLIDEYGKDPTEAFRSKLDAYAEQPVIIVTDYLEESFRHDTGVHVTGPDRTALLERKLNYSFRNTTYRSATIVGRETEGRKDDKILMSALTKPEMLEPWVRALLDRKMRIQCVTSVAYLMEEFSHKAGITDKNLMLVSIEEGSELRQTFLRNGKIQFSRLTSLTTKESSHLPNAINHESMQIRQYLERIKLLPFDSQMSIRVFTPLDIDKDALYGYSNDLNNFDVFNTRDLADSFALSVDGLDRSATTLFLARILQKARLGNVYAPLPTLKYYKLQNLALSLKGGAIALVALVFLIQSFTLIDTLGNWDLIASLRSQTAPLNLQYDQLTRGFPETPIPSAEMALVVENAVHIRNNAYHFEDALALISRALTVSPELQLTNITWSLEEKPDEDENAGFSSMGGFGAPPPSQNAGQEIQAASLKDRTRINISIDGQVYSPQSYRLAQDQVVAFMNALNDAPGITVTSTRMPTDVRVDTNVSTLVDNNELQAPFSIELKLEPMR